MDESRLQVVIKAKEVKFKLPIGQIDSERMMEATRRVWDVGRALSFSFGAQFLGVDLAELAQRAAEAERERLMQEQLESLQGVSLRWE